MCEIFWECSGKCLYTKKSTVQSFSAKSECWFTVLWQASRGWVNFCGAHTVNQENFTAVTSFLAILGEFPHVSFFNLVPLLHLPNFHARQIFLIYSNYLSPSFIEHWHELVLRCRYTHDQRSFSPLWFDPEYRELGSRGCCRMEKILWHM